MPENTTNCYNDGYNHNFTDEDARTLVLIASSPELSLHTCRWTEAGVGCGSAIQGIHFSTHLRYCHGIYGPGFRSLGFPCHWQDCPDASFFSKDGLMMHIREKHLLWKWHCPNCGAAFTGKVARHAHQTLCEGTVVD